jgi:saccharopine dehydrogenase-like NADP-dependent oxidoreductase
MTNILILGAGRSSGSLIQYMLDYGLKNNWMITVADAVLSQAEEKIAGHAAGRAIALDATDEEARRLRIGEADLVISLLPPSLHHLAAVDCLSLGKHLVTASYVSAEMSALDDQVRERGLIFMGEMGLDPGIDHMSAMREIHRIQAEGGTITAFRSYTGGLVAPESDDNPWHYKISWNPRNVVLAGQGTAQYLEEGQFRFLPYRRLFAAYREVDIPGMGVYEGYANRDSLSYREVYGLEGVPTLLRGTLRHPGFCRAWDALIRLGLTEGNFVLPKAHGLTVAGLVDAYLGDSDSGKTTAEKTAAFLGEDMTSEVMHQLTWLGLFEERPITIPNASPALVLEQLLLEKWPLAPDDKDMVIMKHEFEYNLGREARRHSSTMVMQGENSRDTAMARLVGLPLGIFARMVLEGRVAERGVMIPVMPSVYEPILAELEMFGVKFY